MFSNANTLPSISALTSQHHPLSLTAPSPRPVPTGECRFILLHPSIYNQKCTCQCYHHNGKSGSSCECGHQACYHVHTQSSESSPPSSLPKILPTNSDLAVPALLERTRKLEQAFEDERRARENDLKQERQARERDIRMLREALYPFYRTESKLREKLVELEDRIEGNYDEQVRWMERLIEVDDAAMNLEKRLDEIGGPKPKRRRTGRLANSGSRKTSAHGDTPNRTPDPSSPLKKGPSPVQEASSSKSPLLSLGAFSDQEQDLVSRPEVMISPYPRSSGILDSTNLPSPLPTRAVTPFTRQSTPESPRSSGVLDLTTLPAITKPTVDSATTGHTVLVTSTPLFHSSLAPMFDLDQQDFYLDGSIADDKSKGKAREQGTGKRPNHYLADEHDNLPGLHKMTSTAYVTEIRKNNNSESALESNKSQDDVNQPGKKEATQVEA